MADHGSSFVNSYRFHFLFIGLCCLFFVGSSEGRKINMTQENCTSSDTDLCKGKNYSIIHVVAESDDKNNVIHYLWSTVGSPTIVIAYFQGKSVVDLHVNWTIVLDPDTKEKGITFSEKSDYTVALVSPAIYEFPDPKDKVYYNTDEDIVKHSFEKVDWEMPQIDFEKNITTFKGSMLGGNIIFQCNASYHEGRGSMLPRELVTGNSTVFTFTFDHLKNFKDKKKNTRLIFEVFSLATNGGTACLKADRSLDDEHTPAVFKTIVVNNTVNGGMSYFAWKPVAYTSGARSLKCQIPSYMYVKDEHRFVKEEPIDLPTSALRYKASLSIANSVEGITLSRGVNVSFGQPKDGWYQSTNYLSWSGMVGYGTPEFDKFSTVVWIIIFVGFGTPMLVIIVTVIYIIIKRLKRREASSYGRIN